MYTADIYQDFYKLIKLLTAQYSNSEKTIIKSKGKGVSLSCFVTLNQPTI